MLVPGEVVEVESGYLRGHGTYIQDETLLSSVCGRPSRVNKLIAVTPNKQKFNGEIGDLVVGRVSAVEAKRWKIDVNGTKDAVLQLSSVNLPDGSQRMRTHEDALGMRSIFAESDLISAEIQNVNSEGGMALHTRSLKYGRLENGCLIQVPSSLVPRLPQHFISLDSGVDVLLGVNGFIWITRTMPSEWLLESGHDSAMPEVESLFRLQRLHAETPITADTRLKICRVRNSISILATAHISVSPENIVAIYDASEIAKLAPADMLYNCNTETLLNALAR